MLPRRRHRRGSLPRAAARRQAGAGPDADALPARRSAPARCARERLADEPLELPRINYGERNERPYRYVWGAGNGPAAGSTGSSRPTCSDGATPVDARPAATRASRCSSPRPDAEGEDEGVLLSVVLDADAEARSCSCSTPRPRRARPGRGPAPHPVRLPRHVHEPGVGRTARARRNVRDREMSPKANPVTAVVRYVHDANVTAAAGSTLRTRERRLLGVATALLSGSCLPQPCAPSSMSAAPARGSDSRLGHLRRLHPRRRDRVLARGPRDANPGARGCSSRSASPSTASATCCGRHGSNTCPTLRSRRSATACG